VAKLAGKANLSRSIKNNNYMTSERGNDDTATKVGISGTLRLPAANKGLLTSRAQLIQRGMNEADSLAHYLPLF